MAHVENVWMNGDHIPLGVMRVNVKFKPSAETPSRFPSRSYSWKRSCKWRKAPPTCTRRR